MPPKTQHPTTKHPEKGQKVIVSGFEYRIYDDTCNQSGNILIADLREEWHVDPGTLRWDDEKQAWVKK